MKITIQIYDLVKHKSVDLTLNPFLLVHISHFIIGMLSIRNISSTRSTLLIAV